jgi:hypothetical protein
MGSLRARLNATPVMVQMTVRSTSLTIRSRYFVDVGIGAHRAFAVRVSDGFTPIEADIRSLLQDEGASRALGDITLFVLGSRLRDGWPVTSASRRLRAIHPHVGIFVVGSRYESSHFRMIQLARAGIDDLFLADVSGEHERFKNLVERRLGAPPPEEALRAVSARAVAMDRVVLVALWLMRNAYRKPAIDDAAGMFGRERSTIRRWLRNASLPDPVTVIRAGRVLHALQLRSKGEIPSHVFADRLGIHSAAGLRMLLHRARLDPILSKAWKELGITNPLD